MYVVVVSFKIKPDHVAEFREAMVENARASIDLEPGCDQFDVCWNPDDDTDVYLYEIYDDKPAFDEHLASEHFQAFNEKVSDWVADKTVSIFQRAFPKS